MKPEVSAGCHQTFSHIRWGLGTRLLKTGEPENKPKYTQCMLENWLPLGLTMGEIKVVTAAKRWVKSKHVTVKHSTGN